MNAEERVVFAVAPNGMADGKGRDVLLGVPNLAWGYMASGKTHTFDLTKLGLPIRLILFGGRDHSEIMGWINKHNARLDVATEDRRDEDFSIPHKYQEAADYLNADLELHGVSGYRVDPGKLEAALERR